MFTSVVNVMIERSTHREPARRRIPMHRRAKHRNYVRRVKRKAGGGEGGRNGERCNLIVILCQANAAAAAIKATMVYRASSLAALRTCCTAPVTLMRAPPVLVRRRSRVVCVMSFLLCVYVCRCHADLSTRYSFAFIVMKEFVVLTTFVVVVVVNRSFVET